MLELEPQTIDRYLPTSCQLPQFRCSPALETVTREVIAQLHCRICRLPPLDVVLIGEPQQKSSIHLLRAGLLQQLGVPQKLEKRPRIVDDLLVIRSRLDRPVGFRDSPQEKESGTVAMRTDGLVRVQSEHVAHPASAQKR